MFQIFLNINSISYSFRSIANQNGVRYSDSIHHILQNTAVRNVKISWYLRKFHKENRKFECGSKCDLKI
jgi:hypothetical protein